VKILMKMIGNGFLVDSNIIVDFFAGDQKLKTRLEEEIFFIPSIVIGELYFGAYSSGIIVNRQKRLDEIVLFVNTFPVLEVGVNTANYYGEIKTRLKSKGTPIPENDIWISAIAKEHDLTVITKDKHFSYIENLKLTNW